MPKQFKQAMARKKADAVEQSLVAAPASAPSDWLERTRENLSDLVDFHPADQESVPGENAVGTAKQALLLQDLPGAVAALKPLASATVSLMPAKPAAAPSVSDALAAVSIGSAIMITVYITLSGVVTALIPSAIDITQRIAVTRQANGTMSKFINGALVGTQSSTDDRFVLDPSFYIFTDEDNETAPGYVSSFRYVDSALPGEQVRLLGNVNSAGATVAGPRRTRSGGKLIAKREPRPGWLEIA